MKTKLEGEIERTLCRLNGKSDNWTSPTTKQQAKSIMRLINKKMKKFAKDDATYAKYRSIREGANRAYNFLKNYGG